MVKRKFLSGLSSRQFEAGYNKGSRTFSKRNSNRNLIESGELTSVIVGNSNRYLGRNPGENETLDYADLDDRLHATGTYTFELPLFFCYRNCGRGIKRAAYHARVCARTFGGKEYIVIIETKSTDRELCTDKKVSVNGLYKVSSIGPLKFVKDISHLL